MEKLLGEIPKGTHDWNMFIRPEELRRMTEQAGFEDFAIQGFGMRGKDRKTGVLDVRLTRNTSIMYVGKARKAGFAST
jgi:2-polyprenyl-6-hydroxyphenyl methylase/3-demethylubiquinone-9 3-methyltransferase